MSVPFAVGLYNRPVDVDRFTSYGLGWLLRDDIDVSVTPRETWAEVGPVTLARMAKEPHPRARRLAPLLVVLGAALWPLVRLAGRLLPIDGLPVGYDVTARAPAESADAVSA